MSRPRTILAAIFVVVATASCLKLPNVLAPGSPVDFCIEQAKSYCALEFRCCTAAERQSDKLGVFSSPTFDRWAPSTEDECVGLVADICRGSVAEQNESLQNERIQYDADEAQSCLDELHDAVDGCDPKDFFKKDGSYIVQLVASGSPGILGSACEDAVQGDVDDGDTCFADYECKRGFCVVQDNGTITRKGECAGDINPTNPFGNFNGVTIEVCNGLDDEADQ